jgi:hypothetical protein
MAASPVSYVCSIDCDFFVVAGSMRMRRFYQLPAACRTRMATHYRLLLTDPPMSLLAAAFRVWTGTEPTALRPQYKTVLCGRGAMMLRLNGGGSGGIVELLKRVSRIVLACSFKFRHKIPGTSYLFVFLYASCVLIAASYTQTHVYCTPPT